MSIDQISAEIFAARPGKTLFHYSSIAGLKGITDDKGLFASDIHYFNDAAELRHFMDLLHADIARRLEYSTQHQNVLRQFRDWTSDRLPDGNMVFVTSFTENGNLLSQWRGYCPMGNRIRPRRGCATNRKQETFTWRRRDGEKTEAFLSSLRLSVSM